MARPARPGATALPDLQIWLETIGVPKMAHYQEPHDKAELGEGHCCPRHADTLNHSQNIVDGTSIAQTDTW